MFPYHYNSVCMCHYWSMVYCHCSLLLVTGSRQLNCCMLLNTLQMRSTGTKPHCDKPSTPQPSRPGRLRYSPNN